MPILMVTPEGREVDVEEAHFNEALENKLEPAFEMVTPEGKEVVVRKSHFKDATANGLQHKAVYDASRSASRSDAHPGAVESGARGFANVSTAGFADEIAGAAANPLGAAKSLAGLAGVNMSGDADVGEYQRGRDRYRSEDDTAWKEHPLAYGAGASLPIAATLGAAPAAAGTTALKTAGAAAGQAGLSSAGAGTDYGNQADLTKGQVGEFAKDTAIGAGAGLALGAGANKLISKVSEVAPKFAERVAVASTGARQSDFKGPGAMSRAGRTLLDEDLLGSGGVQKAQSTLDDLGSGEQQFLSGLQGEVDLTSARRAILDKVTELRGKSGTGNKKLAKALEKELETIPEGNVSFQDALKRKQDFNESVDYASKNKPTSKKAANIAQSSVRDALESGVAGVTDEATAKTYSADNLRRSKLIKAVDAIKKGQERMDSAPVGATDIATLGLKNVAAKKGLEHTAKLMDSVKKHPMRWGRWGSMLRSAALKGPAQLQHLSEELTQSDPEFAATLQQELGGD